MMKRLVAVLLWSIIVVMGVHAQQSKPGAPTQIPSAIFKNQTSFLSYIAENLGSLSANYTAYDERSNIISKAAFLKAVNTGDYMFLKLNSPDAKLNLKLYKLNPTEKKLYGDIIYAYARTYYDNYKWVGKKFPAFNFTDTNGINYNSNNTRGKVVLVKCWFIGCSACVAEMPELNNLVQQYKNRKDVIFISLAPDSKAKLQAFFKDRRFDYVKVPNENKFMEQVLKVEEYPTHFIINKQGTIVNVVNRPEEVEYTLKNDL